MVTKQLTIIRGVLYVIAEMAGALLGSFLIDVLLPDQSLGVGAAFVSATVLVVDLIFVFFYYFY